MNALLKLRTQMEIDFLKTQTYEEINSMMWTLKNKIDSLEKENKSLKNNIPMSKNEKAIVERVLRPLVDSDYFDDLQNLPVSAQQASKILNDFHRKISTNE